VGQIIKGVEKKFPEKKFHPIRMLPGAKKMLWLSLLYNRLKPCSRSHFREHAKMIFTQNDFRDVTKMIFNRIVGANKMIMYHIVDVNKMVCIL
jgi:hypothetical protein